MKIYIDHDEWWPVYSIDDCRGHPTEMTEADIARIKAVFIEFEKVQQELRALVTKEKP